MTTVPSGKLDYNKQRFLPLLVSSISIIDYFCDYNKWKYSQLNDWTIITKRSLRNAGPYFTEATMLQELSKAKNDNDFSSTIVIEQQGDEAVNHFA